MHAGKGFGGGAGGGCGYDCGDKGPPLGWVSTSPPWTCIQATDGKVCGGENEDGFSLLCGECKRGRPVFRVRGLDGKWTWHGYDPLDTFAAVKEKHYNKVGTAVDQQRLIFAGAQLHDNHTLAALGIPPGSTLHLVLRLRGSIGVFDAGAAAALAPGAALLRLPAPAASPPPAAAVAALAAAVLAPSARPPLGAPFVFEGTAEAASPAARAALTAAVEAEWARGAPAGVDAAYAALAGSPAAAEAAGVAGGSTRRDFRMLLAAPTVAAALGAGGVAAILGALEAVRGAPAGAAPLAPASVVFALRRTEARAEDPEWINFHYDSAAITAQVPLSGRGDIVGGRTVFALASGELLVPERAAGAVLAHHGDVAHGVTALEKGVRYGLYALVARGDC
jgi:hypothetical protein